jgi:hypothetical protein
MKDKDKGEETLPPRVAAIKRSGYAAWSGQGPLAGLEDKFDGDRMKVENIRHVRVWGLQVDDERELPGHERTMIPDEEIWQVVLVAKDGSRYEVNSELLVPASET